MALLTTPKIEERIAGRHGKLFTLHRHTPVADDRLTRKVIGCNFYKATPVQAGLSFWRKRKQLETLMENGNLSELYQSV